MPRYDYDLIVIGGGSAGLVGAKLGIGLGKRVALVEKNKIGGECTWTGCVPSKTIIKSANVAYLFKHLNKFGLRTESTSFDTSQVMNHVQKVIQEVYQYETPEKIREEGIEVLIGNPTFVDHHTLKVDQTIISADKFLIATGSRPLVPPIEGLDTVQYVTNETFFSLKQLPSSMVILGGGAIGTEMASALNRLGVTVTIVEMQDRILVKEDQELVEVLTTILQNEQVQIKTGIRATKVMQEQGTIMVQGVSVKDDTPLYISAESLLVAVGRHPNIEGLGLDTIGVSYDKKRIQVDKTLRTSVKNIYAAGDIVGPYLFSHMAYYQAAIAVRNAFIPFKKKVDYTNVCWVTFCAPELASAGLTEQAARIQYKDRIFIYRYPYDKLDRSYTDSNLQGLGKFICDKKGRLIGAHILGAHAGDLINEVQLGKTYGIPFAHFYPVIYAYPTYSELIWHASKFAYIDQLLRNPFIAFAHKLYRWWKRKTS